MLSRRLCSASGSPDWHAVVLRHANDNVAPDRIGERRNVGQEFGAGVIVRSICLALVIYVKRFGGLRENQALQMLFVNAFQRDMQ
jgi:hypothetical protein